MTDSSPRRWGMYIDGYNFYYAIKNRPAITPLHLGWCDFGRLGDAMVAGRGHLDFINYYTAPVGHLGSTDGELGGEAARQATWLRALGSIPRLKIVHGFHSRAGNRDQKEPVKKRTEKQTDVNIAVSLVRDSALDLFDSAIVITADSDQIPAVRVATKDFGKDVEVWLPPGAAIGRWAECRPIRRIKLEVITQDLLRMTRMPDELVVGKQRIETPPSWRDPTHRPHNTR